MAKKISKEGRRKALLGILQRESGSLITEELHAQQSHWIEQIPHLKTTLRDLKALASEGLVSGEKPFGQKSYRWKLRKARLDLALTPSESMTWSPYCSMPSVSASKWWLISSWSFGTTRLG
ncbi:hypothetical protein ACSQ5K_15115 [Pseudomonas sp. PhalM4]